MTSFGAIKGRATLCSVPSRTVHVVQRLGPKIGKEGPRKIQEQCKALENQWHTVRVLHTVPFYIEAQTVCGCSGNARGTSHAPSKFGMHRLLAGARHFAASPGSDDGFVRGSKRRTLREIRYRKAVLQNESKQFLF